jgi:hypothetical protein
MPVLTTDALYRRVGADPVGHLGERSPRTLHAYSLGYQAGLAHHGAPPLVDELGRYFNQWIDARIELTEEHERRLNARSCFSAVSYALLHSADEVEALDRYLALWSEALAHVRASRIEVEPSGAWEYDMPLIEQLRLVGQRPGMWFGSSNVAYFWAFASGFGWAEQDMDRSSLDVARLRAFQSWMDERYPFGRGVSWARTIRCLAMEVAERSHGFCLEHLDMFLAGADADAPDPTMEKMFKAIVAHASSKKPDGDDPSE